jgi:hypothetical protein
MMVPTSNRFRRSLLAAAVLASSLSVACNGTEAPIIPNQNIVGSYVATRFIVTPTGKPAINVLTLGGALTIDINASKQTTGALTMPAGVFGPDAVNQSMAGTVEQSGYTVVFVQAANTFIRSVEWLAGGGTIQTDVSDGSARIEVTLTRQGS